MDKELTIDDWLEIYKKVQDEDIAFLTGEELKDLFFSDPPNLLLELKNRGQRRRAIFQFLQYLKFSELSEEKLEEVHKQLTFLVAREKTIHEMVYKILDLMEEIWAGKKDHQKAPFLEEINSSENSKILH